MPVRERRVKKKKKKKKMMMIVIIIFVLRGKPFWNTQLVNEMKLLRKLVPY
jgi:hypothetical protein